MSDQEKATSLDTTYLDEEMQQALIHRLARVEGHVRAIRRMVEERRCADEILVQVAAVKAALNKFAITLLTQEVAHCVNNCMTGEVDERLERITQAMGALLKQS